jgi:hypothetical protein
LLDTLIGMANRMTFHQSLRWTATGLLEAEEFDRLARVREPATERE